LAEWAMVHSAGQKKVIIVHSAAEWAMFKPNGRYLGQMGDDRSRMDDVRPNGRWAEWAMQQKWLRITKPFSFSQARSGFCRICCKNNGICT